MQNTCYIENDTQIAVSLYYLGHSDKKKKSVPAVQTLTASFWDIFDGRLVEFKEPTQTEDLLLCT